VLWVSLVLLSFLIIHPSSLAAVTYYVDGWLGNNGFDGLAATAVSSRHGPMRNISQAIAAASDGDTIVAAPGCYQETLWEAGSKSVTLTGPGTVIITGSDPVTTSSAGDGLPDAWLAWQGLNPFNPGVVSLASSLSWANGTNNLAAYQLSQIPPTITATITPTPNAAGWNNTNVVVHFSASSTGSGIAWITSDIMITGATNDCSVTGYAMDNAGNLVSADVLVNIDLTPPIITLDPGDGATVDLSNPWLTMQFSDPSSNMVSAGLNYNSLTITMDGVDVTTNFFLSTNGAVGDASAAPTGWHTNIISIADGADNVTSATNSFYATGAVNPDAPTLANCNLAGGIVAPDSDQLWVQAEPSQTTNVSVVASVNGGAPIPLDLIGQTAGGFIQVDPSVTNVIVLYVTKTGDTTQSTAVRSRRRKSSLPSSGSGSATGAAGFSVSPSPGGFHCEITSPGLDTFANGQPQTVAGVVTPTEYAGTINETNVVSVTVNGVATTLSTTVNADGYLTFTTVTPVPVATDGSSTSVNGVVCLANGQCFTIPLAVLEGYEILKKRVSYSSVIWEFSYIPYPPLAGICPDNWIFDVGAGDWFQSAFDASTGTGSVVDLAVTVPVTTSPTNVYICASIPTDTLKAQLSVTGTNVVTSTPAILPSSLGLTFGTSSLDYWRMSYNNGDPNNPTSGADTPYFVDYPAGENNSITFRAPQKYKPSARVIFTFEGMSYATGPGDTMNLSNVTFNLPGATVDPNFRFVSGNNVSYRVTLNGGQVYTINQDCFTWPPATTSTTSDIWGDTNSDWVAEADTTTANTLSFTGFHNKKSKWKINRYYQSQADAICDGCGLSISDLATNIHLEAAEWNLWLDNPPYVERPTSESELIWDYRKFYIPNEAHITQGFSDTAFDYLKHKKDLLITNIYKLAKYKIVDHFLPTGINQYLGQDMVDVTNILARAENIYVWAHFGHGVMVNGNGGNLFFWAGSDYDILTPSGVHPQYKLAEVVLFSCQAGQKKQGWLDHVAKGGMLYSTTNNIPVLASGYGQFYPSWWFSYMPLTGTHKN